MLDPALGEVEAPGSPVERPDGALEFGMRAAGGARTAEAEEAFPEIGPAEEAPARRRAPNGAPSRLTERQWAQVRTPEFKARFGDWEAAALQKWLEGEPVAAATGHEYEDVPVKSIIEAVYKNWERVGHRAANPEIGEVVLSKSGIRDSLAHGIGRNKIAAFDSVPEIIARGRVVRFRENWSGRGYDSRVVAAPMSIGGKACVALAVVNTGANGNRFYLHEVGVVEDLKKYAEVMRTGSSDEKSALSRNLGDVKKIAQSLFSVNPDSFSKIVDANGEPLPVWHGGRTDNRFGAFDPARISQREDGVRGFYFAPPARRDSVAGYYGHGQERSFWLNIRHPLVLGPDEHPGAEALAAHDGIVRVAEEDYPERSFWNWRTDRLETERLLKGDIIEIVAFRPEQIFPVEGAEESGSSAPSETAAERKRSAAALEAGLDVEALKEEARPSYGSSGAGGRPESRPTSEMP